MTRDSNRTRAGHKSDLESSNSVETNRLFRFQPGHAPKWRRQQVPPFVGARKGGYKQIENVALFLLSWNCIYKFWLSLKIFLLLWLSVFLAEAKFWAFIFCGCVMSMLLNLTFTSKRCFPTHLCYVIKYGRYFKVLMYTLSPWTVLQIFFVWNFRFRDYFGWLDLSRDFWGY